MEETRDPPIYTVSEMIERAFGDPKKNVVNLKLIQVILVILARRLNVLDRWIPVVTSAPDFTPGQQISVSEMKLHANRRHLGKKKSHRRSNLSMHSHTSTTEMQKSAEALHEVGESKETLSSEEIAQSQEEFKKGKQKIKKGKGQASTEKFEETTGETREDRDDDLLLSSILAELKKKSGEVMSTADLHQESLLVELTPEETADGSKFITEEQFQKLVDVVIELQKKYGPADVPDFPVNVVVEGVPESAPLSSAMGAMQLAESMEILESSIDRLFVMLREIVMVKIKEAKAAARKERDTEDEDEEEEEKEEGGGGGAKGAFATDPILIYTAETAKKVSTPKSKSADSTELGTTPAASAMLTDSDVDTAIITVATDERKVTVDELETAMWDMYDDCFKGFLSGMKKCNTNTAVTKERCAKYGGKLKLTEIADEVMNELEAGVLKYTSRIDVLNNIFSVTTINFQDQLASMNHELEGGLMYFFDSCSKQPKRHAAIAELISKFMDKLEEIEEAKSVIVEFRERQDKLFKQLSGFRDKLQVIANVKSSRTEMNDSLEKNVSLEQINGYILKAQGHAVQGDMQKKIKNAYEKFNTKEYLWQKGLDDLTRYLNDRVDLKELESFKNSARRVADMIAGKLNYMMNIAGDAPKEMRLSKKIMRNVDCASCGAPMTKEIEKIEKENIEPNVFEERAKGKQVRDKKRKVKKERDVCFPGLPVPRRRICSKYKIRGSTFEPLPCIDIKQAKISAGTQTQTAGQNAETCSYNMLPILMPSQAAAVEPCDEPSTEVQCEIVTPKTATMADRCDELCTEIPCKCVLPKTTDPCDELCIEIPSE